MNISDILSQLGLVNKETVYLSVTQGIGLEAIQIDSSAKIVKKYAYRLLAYNDSLKEIPDINAFKTAVTELFAELNVNIKSNVVLNVPLVLIGTKELPTLLDDNSVTQALMSEVEQSYIFKRYEPIINWADISDSSNDMRNLIYSAIQKNVLDDIKTALTELGANLVKITVSTTSLLKALNYTGLITTQVENNTTWNFMVVNQIGYSICSMIGNKIVDYYEEPLAIKSFEDEELYNVINASAQIALMSFPANYLYIVSCTDAVSAEILSKKLQVDYPVNFIENNQFKKQDYLPVSMEIIEETASKISLEAIGVAANDFVKLPIEFSFLDSSAGRPTSNDANALVHVVLGSKEFDISPAMAQRYSIIIGVLLLIPFLLLAIAIPIVAKNKQSQADEVQTKLQTVQAEIKKFEEDGKKSDGFDVNAEIKKVLNDNRLKLISYAALGESVPKNLWLTYYVSKDEGKIDIKGNASNVEDVYTFYRNMKESLINTQLRLYKLDLKASSIDEEVSIDPNQPSNYEFEVTNMSEAELMPKVEKNEKDDKDDQKGPGANPDGKKDLLNKPLINLGKAEN